MGQLNEHLHSVLESVYLNNPKLSASSPEAQRKVLKVLSWVGLVARNASDHFQMMSDIVKKEV